MNTEKVKENNIDFYHEELKSKNNKLFVENCFFETHALIHGGLIDESYQSIANDIKDVLLSTEFQDLINKRSNKYKFNNLGNLEKTLLAVAYFLISNLSIEKDKKLFIDSILELAKEYVSKTAHKLINATIAVIV